MRPLLHQSSDYPYILLCAIWYLLVFHRLQMPTSWVQNYTGIAPMLAMSARYRPGSGTWWYMWLFDWLSYGLLHVPSIKSRPWMNPHMGSSYFHNLWHQGTPPVSKFISCILKKDWQHPRQLLRYFALMIKPLSTRSFAVDVRTSSICR